MKVGYLTQYSKINFRTLATKTESYEFERVFLPED